MVRTLAISSFNENCFCSWDRADIANFNEKIVTGDPVSTNASVDTP